MSIEDIKNELVSREKDYDLEGVEITEEDALYVDLLMKGGYCLEVAIGKCLEEIYECLN